MGRVRSLYIKRAARELLERYPDKFSPSFEENRKFLDEKLKNVGKPLRNRIAGYISTLLKQEKEE
ncbi:MAG: 30S ribosomal protein S17e [Hadesarchaea archaeon]|nr:MAG: 30S ribosomal protein S17e [Hadesarchaea archaeon]HDI13096.1 30S ribosomal protein S17e [Hadesarchaea archaeon]